MVGYGTEFEARTGTAGNDGDELFIGQLQDCRDFGSRRRIDDGVGQVEEFPFYAFIPFVGNEAVRIGRDAFGADDGL